MNTPSGVKIEANDDTARIDPGCTREGSSGEVKGREHAITQQKSVGDACGIAILPYDVALGVVRALHAACIHRGAGRPSYTLQLNSSERGLPVQSCCS